MGNKVKVRNLEHGSFHLLFGGHTIGQNEEFLKGRHRATMYDSGQCQLVYASWGYVRR